MQKILRQTIIFIKETFYGFELPPQKNIDIDNQNDWEFAEKLLKLKNL